MKFLENIGNKEWPKIILFRMKNHLYEFEIKNGQPTVSVKYFRDLDGDLLKYLSTFENYSIVDKPVLLLELEENEVDPKFDFIGTLIYCWSSSSSSV